MSTYEKNKARIRGRTDYPDPPLNRTLRALIASCPAHASVLDIACGSGRVLAALQDKGCDCRGIDLSPGAIAVCKAKGLDAIEGDVDSFQTNQTVHDFLLAPSDVVVFSKCLNYLREKKALMQQLQARTIFIHQNNPGYWREIVRRGFNRDRPQHFSEELPYVSAHGNCIEHASATAVKHWGESFGYRGSFVTGGNIFSGGYLLKLEKA